ncbi:hypothetical protein Q8W71_02190 [Methylobacterium sp. NEAU 140]|uniref:hypothetical protein n=1 Tax=Methylobacterium sp. NEAU 140 TaxID=3064945 RepID=UPI00273392FF|nr:hypothetical protein [Methylobacterium sp. NEAU 140]MDP4021418.1 hypothetical protein [Methylobacterium sp. NEAU 140]
MRWDGAQNAKAEVFRRAFGYAAAGAGPDGVPAFLPCPDSAVGERVARGRREGLRAAADLIAVGVSAMPGDPRQVVLALVLQHHRLRDHPIVLRARQIAGATECALVVAGPAVPPGAADPGTHRPLRLGAPVGRADAPPGSLGFFATCRASGARGFVSTNHALADANAGAPGDPILHLGAAAAPGEARQGAHQGARQGARQVARLRRFRAIDGAAGGINTVDGAFAELIEGIACQPHRIGEPLDAPGDPGALLERGMAVVKVGPATERTAGTVAVVRLDNLTTTLRAGGFARFDGQVAVRGGAARFAAPGDGGALVATRTGRPVGLLHAVTTGGLAYASPIRDVLDALDVDLHARP